MTDSSPLFTILYMALLEREPHLAVLNAALAEAGSGTGRLALVRGEAGIGKTALLELFAAGITLPVPVCWGACDALFTPRPFGPLHDMSAQIGGELPKLLASNAPRATLFSAILEELQRRSLVVVFEDVHWADEATLDLLRFLGRRINWTSALLILSYRDDELHPLHPLRRVLGDFPPPTITKRILLPPLSKSALGVLVKNRDLDVAALHHQTGGNPFYVTEVLANPEKGIPPTVRDAVLARVARLSPSGYAVLEAAAVIGQRINPWILATVTGAEAPAVDECLAVGVLWAQDNSLFFRHELARNVILELISPPRRPVLHRLVLDALKVSPHTPIDMSRLAHHAAASGDPAAILLYARAAGKEAAALGMHRAAAAQFAKALEYAADLSLIAQIELNEAYALSTQGDPTRTATIAAYRRAAELARQAGLPEREGFLLVRLSGVLNIVGQAAEAEKRLQEALTILEPLAPNRGLIDAYRLLAMKHLSLGEPHSAIDYAERSYQMALATEQVRVIASAYQIMGLCWLPLDHEKGREHLEKCLIMSLENNEYWAAAALYPNLIMTYVDVYMLDRAEELLGEALSYTSERDMDAATHFLQAWQAMLFLFQGRWRECQTSAESLLKHPELQMGSRNAALAALGRLQARQGEAQQAQNLLDGALAQSLKFGNLQRNGVYYCAAAEAAWLAGDQGRLRQYIHDFHDIAVQNRQPGFAAELAYWRWLAGDSVETYEWMLQPFVQQIQGDWQGAASTWAALGCPYEQARALAEGDIAAQKAALIVFEQLGARPMAARLRQQLRSVGVQIIPRGSRSTTRENPFGLTNRQVEVLRLLTENLTNVEIAARLNVSPKTVDHHVSAVLGKLSVPSREEAAALARQHPNF